MVKSEKIYSPQGYLEAVTGKCYIVNGCNDIETIQCVLNEHELDLWDYPMSEIDHIVENQLNVVLVDCMVENNATDEFDHIFRWFEVPEDFSEKE